MLPDIRENTALFIGSQVTLARPDKMMMNIGHRYSDTNRKHKVPDAKTCPISERAHTHTHTHPHTHTHTYIYIFIYLFPVSMRAHTESII